MRRPPISELLRREDGMTLVELLVGAVIGLIVLSSAMLVLDNSIKLARVTDQRVDATQRGREAMETVTRELRSQVCLGSTPALTAAGDSSVTYFVNLNGIDATPERHELSLVSGELILRRFVPTGTPPALTFPATPTSSRVLLENVQQITGTPLFRYYGWTAGTPVVPSTLMATPLNSASLALPVKIAVSFRVNPGSDFRNQRGAAELHDSVFMRAGDPTDTSTGPRCN